MVFNQWIYSLCYSIFIVLKKVHFDDFEEAKRAAKDGELWGVIQFSGNFSENLVARITHGVNDANLETINNSQIGINLDESS